MRVLSMEIYCYFTIFCKRFIEMARERDELWYHTFICVCVCNLCDEWL